MNIEIKLIREQMRETLECPVNAFLADYSPFVPDDALVQAAVQALAREQLLVVNKEGKPDHWQESEEEPRYSPWEMKVFKLLEDIANVLDNDLGVFNGRQRQFFYRNCPYNDVKAEISGSNFKIDVCFIGNRGHAQNNYVTCAEAAVVVGFKRFTKDFEDNREKLISAASHIMNDDPCRMWMYGITIENTKMAVWCFSRSHSVKSEAFNITTDIETFIRVFLSFVYATRKEMGYDTTVHRINDKGIRYVYEIPTENGTRYFKTGDLLAHQRVLCITGRNTRVWKAIEVKGFEGDAVNEKPNGNTEVALKDVWLDDGSTTEKQKLDAIFEQLKTVEKEAYQWAPPSLRSKLKATLENEGYKDYFMEIVCDSFNLGRSKETSDQTTPAPDILAFSGKASVGDDNGKAKVLEDQNMLTDLTQTTGCNHTTQDNPKQVYHLKANPTSKTCSYKVKRQYRLVYKEVGESLDRVKTLETAFTALLDASIALVLMYLAGWMHRDVSAGNIIVVTRPGGKCGGKLSDLEYTKHCEDKSSDPKTGTAFFMPLEIHTGVAYNSLRTTSKPDSPTDSEDVDPFDDRPRPPAKQNLFAQILRPRQPPRLKYRSQHDLESLWWVALYVLIYRVEHTAGNLLSNKVFTSTSLPTVARQELFEYEDAVMEELQEFLHPELQHELIIEPMNKIPRILFKSYFLHEPVDPEALGKVYRRVFRKLAILVLTIRTEVRNVKFYPTHHVQSKKRARPETSSKPQDDDEYKAIEDDEEPSSDDAVRRRKKKATVSTSVCR